LYNIFDGRRYFRIILLLKLLFFYFFKKISEIVNFRRPTETVENSHSILAAENKFLFSAARLLFAENSLFSAVRCQPPKIIAYFGLIFSGRERPSKTGLKPSKISYFRRQIPYFLRPRATKNNCTCCSEPSLTPRPSHRRRKFLLGCPPLDRSSHWPHAAATEKCWYGNYSCVL
jgi:hypothetical protein